ncbi:MAG: helix-turn-helix domain-containing protein, partial [bacterium]
AFLETFAAAEEIELSPETTEVLADYSLASIRAVEGALTRVMARASLGGGELTPELVETVLGTAELEREFEDRSVVTIDQIKSLVSERFSVSLEDLDSSKRSERVSSARQVAMTLAREFTAMSLPAIASAFCRKDHSTVIHGINRIDSRVQTDHEFADLVEKCRSELRAR